MTVNDPGFVVQAGDGRSVQIDAPNVIIPNQDEVIADEEEVDENYDPTFFLQSLPQQQTVIEFWVHSVEGFFYHSDFTWNQFCRMYIEVQKLPFLKIQLSVLELLDSQNWFHVKSEW